MSIPEGSATLSGRARWRLENLMEESSDMVCSVDINSRIIQVNAASETILGYKPGELSGRNLFDFIHPDDKDAAISKAKWLMAGNEINNFENRYIRKDGSLVYLSWSSKWDPRDKVRYGIARNITAKKKQEEILVESEQKYWNLFENSPLPVLLWDLQTGPFTDCNAATLAKYGYSREEFLKLTVKDLWPIGDTQVDIGEVVSTIESGKVFKTTRMHRVKSGEIICVDLNGQLIVQNGKRMALAMINDVTEQYYFHALDNLERELLEKCALQDTVLSEALDKYLLGVEALHPGSLCSILENRDGRLFNLSSPGLPLKYIRLIDGAVIGEKAGPCSLTALQKQLSVFSNIQKAPTLSSRFKAAAAENHLKACWSHPILDGSGAVMATFACFTKTEREPSEYEQKTTARAVNILQVILESRRREQALRTSNARFEKAAEATFDVIWDWNIDTDEVYYSENFKKLFGHEAGVKRNNLQFYIDHVHPDDLDRVLLHPDILRTGSMTNWFEEYRFRKADGGYAYVRDRAVLVRDGSGKVMRMIGALKDITEQKKEEQRLKLLESVATNTTDAVIIAEAISVDDSGPRILYVNEAFTKMTGYAADEIIGKTPGILQGPKSNMTELKRMAEAVNNGEAFEGTIINYRKNGEEFWKEFSVVPVTNAEGVCTHMIAMERDITDRKNRELQKSLMSDIAKVFAESEALLPALQKTVKHLACFGQFSMAEVWLTNTEANRADMVTKVVKNDAMELFYDESKNSRSIPVPLNGLLSPGTPPFEFWHHSGEPKLLRYDAAIKAGLKSAYIVPLNHEGRLVGILVLGSDQEEKLNSSYARLFEQFGTDFGGLVKRKQLEDELNQVFNFTPDILCILNTDGYFKKVNPAMCAILEYTEQELLSRPFTDFIHPQDREKTQTELTNVISGNPTYYLENRYVTKSGKIKWLAWTSTGASEQGAIYCSGKDTTDKKELEELFNKATSLARIGSWEVDVPKQTVFWSDMTREIHEAEPGYQPDIAGAIAFYKEGRDRDTIMKVIGEAISSGTPGDVELQIVTAKGNNKWVRVIAEADFSGDKCLRAYGSLQDIDVRKRAEIAGNEALKERTTILESIGDAFFAVDKNWTVTYWNNTAERALMTPRGDILNHNLWDVFTDSTGSTSYKKYYEAMIARQRVQFEDYFAFLDRWFEISAYPSDNGLSVYFKDITDRKKSDLQLKELNESLEKHARELAASNAELEQFAFVASHDLQEPLRMITSFMTQLERKYAGILDDKGKQYIHFAVDGAKRMREIILDLLDFSTVGKTDEAIELVDINQLVDSILALYRRQIEESRAQITFKHLPSVQTFKSPIRQVFQNLLGNSLKYRKQGVPPVISISSRETKTHYHFLIKDNGIGISPQFFDKIFIIFQRLHNKDEYSGTGMGLAITKKIVENLGGKIWVESTEGAGSTFHFTLLKSPVHEIR